ncbi:MAG: large subunit ribosomal protein L3 [Pseudoalteromonas tetraodonis]|jgi:large subunit ribosomal protein L3
MSIGLLGKKIGMTRIYNEDGAMVPVTVVEVSDNTVLQIRNGETDGYTAVQVGYDEQIEKRVNKPELGHFKKAKSDPKRFIREFRTKDGEEIPELGSKVGVDLFEAGQFVDIIGTSKGKGFQGVYKRYNFGGLKETHGSMMHRRTGSIGPGSTPGRVWKNTKMPGRHGTDRVTIQNLKVVEARPDDNVLLISGAIPGAKGGYIVIRPAVKKAKPAK